MKSRAQRRAMCLALLGIGLLASPVVAADADPERTGALQSATWHVSAWGRSAAGLACWLRDGTGLWRLDILLAQNATGEPATMGDLLGQSGDGWTVVATGDKGVYLQPWRDRIEDLSPERARRVTALFLLAAAGCGAATDLAGCGAEVGMLPEQRNIPRTPWSGSGHTGAEDCVLTWPADGDAGLRSRLETRGRGRGAEDETWRVRFAGDRDWRLTSSRRPGALEVEALPDRAVSYYADEVFIPLWPMGELLTPVR